VWVWKFIYLLDVFFYFQPILGKIRKMPSYLDKRLCQEILAVTSNIEEFQTFIGATMGADDFYRGLYSVYYHHHLLTHIPLSGVSTTCFSSCCDKDSLPYHRPPAWCQPSLEMKRVLMSANAAGTNGLKCLPKHGQALDKTFCLPIRWFLRTLLNFRVRTPRGHRAEVCKI
jgi:hypothetical protein